MDDTSIVAVRSRKHKLTAQWCDCSYEESEWTELNSWLKNNKNANRTKALSL